MCLVLICFFTVRSTQKRNNVSVSDIIIVMAVGDKSILTSEDNMFVI